MTREEARKAAEVMLAYANGEEIETLCFREYIPCEDPSFNWVEGKGIENYRIKPKPRYRPFKTQEECWNEMLKHQPFGWIKGNITGEYKQVIHVFNYGEIELIFNISYNSPTDYSPEMMFSSYTFTDGTPFGIKEE